VLLECQHNNDKWDVTCLDDFRFYFEARDIIPGKPKELSLFFKWGNPDPGLKKLFNLTTARGRRGPLYFVIHDDQRDHKIHCCASPLLYRQASTYDHESEMVLTMDKDT